MTKFEKQTKCWFSTERLNIVMNAEKRSSLLNKVYRNSTYKMMRTVQLQAWHVHCPIDAQIGLLMADHVWEFCYSFYQCGYYNYYYYYYYYYYYFGIIIVYNLILLLYNRSENWINYNNLSYSLVTFWFFTPLVQVISYTDVSVILCGLVV